MKATIWRALTALLGLCVWMLVPGEAAATPLHRWLFNEGGGATAVDSGSSPVNDRSGRLVYTSWSGSTLVAATVPETDPEVLDPERD